jgi:hypothetical protein
MISRTLLFLLISILLFVTSCVDLYTKEYKIIGPYYVAKDPVASYKSLYYDLGNGCAIERIRDVKRVGHTKNHIIVEIQEGFYFINRDKDSKYLEGRDVRGELKNHDYFLKWLDSLKISDFQFDYD